MGRRGASAVLALALLGACRDPGSDDRGACTGDVVLVSTTAAFPPERADIVALTVNGDVRRLTDDGEAFGPALSPDGSEIAFAAVGPDGEVSDSLGPYRLDIVVMDVDGSDRRTIVDGLDARQPDWSPDGERIAYVERGDDVTELPDRIHVVDADGSDDRVHVAHDGTEDDADPAWSPDGDRMAFVRRSVDGASQVAVADADGTVEVLYEAPTWLGAPAWSPDGSRLAFPSGSTSQGPGLLVLDVETGSTTEVPSRIQGVAWAPNGRLYGFVASPGVNGGGGRVTELEPDGDGFGAPRTITAIPGEGFLYTDFGVDVPACLGSGSLR